MGNCVTQEMPQPRRRRRAPDYEEEVYPKEETRSIATTLTRIEEEPGEDSPNAYSSEEDRSGSKGLQKFTNESEGPKTSGDPPIKEPPVIKRCINLPTKEDGTKAGNSVPKEKAKVVFQVDLQPATDSNQISVENLDKMNVDQPSDTDSMSSQASHEVEPRALTLEKPAKTRTRNNTFKKSAGLSLCLFGLLAGFMLVKQISEPRDLQSFLMSREKHRPVVECTGKACQFLNWVDAQNGICSIDRNRTEDDVRHTLCPSYRSNSTLPGASAPVCNFAAWLDAQNGNEQCSLDVHKRVTEIWSKYSAFGWGKE